VNVRNKTLARKNSMASSTMSLPLSSAGGAGPLTAVLRGRIAVEQRVR